MESRGRNRPMNPVYVLLVIITMIAGLTPIGARMATSELPVFTLAWFRFGTAGALLWLTLRARGQRLPFTRRDVPRLLLLAVLCVPINQAGFLGGVKLANASHAGLFYALGPVLVFWGSVLTKATRYSHLMLAAAALAFAGAATVALPALVIPEHGRSMLAGDGLLLLAIASWSTFVVVSKPMIARHRPLPTLTGVFLLGTLLHTPLVFIDLHTLNLPDVTWHGATGFAFITLVTSYVNYLLIYFVLSRYDATRAMIVTNGNFIVTVLVEHFAFDEPVTSYFFVGATLITLAILLDHFRTRRAMKADRMPE